MDKVEEISVFFFAGGDGRPDALAAAHTGLTAGALCNSVADDRMANFPLGSIIRRLNMGFGQKPKIRLGSLNLESLSHLFCQWMVWRFSHHVQKALLELFHSSGKMFCPTNQTNPLLVKNGVRL